MQCWPISVQVIHDLMVSWRQYLRAIYATEAWSELLWLDLGHAEIWLLGVLESLLSRMLDTLGCAESTPLGHLLLPSGILSSLGESLKLLLGALDLSDVLDTLTWRRLLVDLWLESELILVPLVPVFFRLFVALFMLSRLEVEVEIVITCHRHVILEQLVVLPLEGLWHHGQLLVLLVLAFLSQFLHSAEAHGSVCWVQKDLDDVDLVTS